MGRFKWLGLALLLVIAVAVVAALAEHRSTTAQSDTFIPVVARSDVWPEELSSTEVGTECRLIDHGSVAPQVPYQLVIRDSNDQVVKIHSLDGEIALDDSGEKRCIADAEIPVPDGEFFTVYLGDERIRGYERSDFPIKGWDRLTLYLE